MSAYPLCPASCYITASYTANLADGTPVVNGRFIISFLQAKIVPHLGFCVWFGDKIYRIRNPCLMWLSSGHYIELASSKLRQLSNFFQHMFLYYFTALLDIRIFTVLLYSVILKMTKNTVQYILENCIVTKYRYTAQA